MGGRGATLGSNPHKGRNTQTLRSEQKKDMRSLQRAIKAETVQRLQTNIRQRQAVFDARARRKGGSGKNEEIPF